MDSDRKANLLLHLAGPAVQDVFNSIADPLSSALPDDDDDVQESPEEARASL